MKTVTHSVFTYKACFKIKLLDLSCRNACSPGKLWDRSQGINSSELDKHTLYWKCHYNAYNFNKIIANHSEVMGGCSLFLSNWKNYQRFQLSALCLLCFILFMPWSVSWKWNSFTNLVTTLAEIKDKGSNIDTEGIRFAVKTIPQRKRERHLNMIILNARQGKGTVWFWCSKDQKAQNVGIKSAFEISFCFSSCFPLIYLWMFVNVHEHYQKMSYKVSY